MTILYKDTFETDTVGALPTGWVNIGSGAFTVVTTNPVSGARALAPTTSNAGQVAMYTGAAGVADQVVTASQINLSSTAGMFGVIARGNSTAALGYLVTLTATQMLLYKITAVGVYAQLGTTATVSLPAGTPIMLELSTIGTTIAARVWDAAAARPTTAQISVTDATTASGVPGVYYSKNAMSGIASLDDFYWSDASGAAATLLTLAGPSTGSVGANSSNFTVAADGETYAGVTVTPSDGGAGGTFTPSSFILSGAAPIATFTYNAASAGAKTISITNSGSLTNPSSLTYTASVTPATAITLSGPTSGFTATASSAFTVGANGSISGSNVVTPSDSGAGGTFTPTAVTLSSGTTTGTFTYTAATAGTATISVSNSGGLTNPSTITYTSTAAQQLIVVDNSLLTWSPYNWDTLLVGDFSVATKSKQTSCCGAYLKFQITGTATVALTLDPTPYAGYSAGNTPLLLWNIDDGPSSTLQVAVGQTSVSLATGLATGTQHTVQVYLLGTHPNGGDRWGSSGVSPTNVIRIKGVTVDGTATVSAYPLSRSKSMVFFGDSITEGQKAAGTTTFPQDHARSSAWWVGRSLGAEVGVIGYGGSGWSQGGSGNIPAFTSNWNLHSVGRSRSFASAPDYAFVMHGFNGTFTAATVTAWITSARTAFGAGTWIFVVANPGAVNNSFNSAGVAAYISANPSDAKVAYVNLADVIESDLFSGTGAVPNANDPAHPTWGSIDKCHPLEVANGMIASAISAKAQKVIDGVASTTTIQAIGLGGLGLTTTGQLVAVL